MKCQIDTTASLPITEVAAGETFVAPCLPDAVLVISPAVIRMDQTTIPVVIIAHTSAQKAVGGMALLSRTTRVVPVRAVGTVHFKALEG